MFGALALLTTSLLGVNTQAQESSRFAVTSEESELTVKEGGGQKTFSVALASAPNGGSAERYTVDAAVAAQIEVTPNVLEFGENNWDQPVSVTIEAVDDSVVEQTENLLLFEIGGDGVGVTVEDNDGLEITAPNGYELVEGGDGVDIDLTFATDPTIEAESESPTGSVTVNLFPGTQLSIADPVEAVPIDASGLEEETPAMSIQFDGDNYRETRTVRIAAVDDEGFEGERTGRLRMTIGSDNEEIPYMEKTLEFTITDDEVAPEEGCQYLVDTTGGDCSGVPDVGTDLPNAGDGNNDGIVDTQQETVRTAYNSTNTAFVTVGASQPVLEIVAKSSENTRVSQFGEIAFAVQGSSADVEVYLYPETPLETGREYAAVKINGQDLTRIEGATVSEIVVDGQNVLKASFSLTDGGEYDQDGVVNGIIVDPMSIVPQESLETQDNSNSGDSMTGEDTDTDADAPAGGLIRTGGADSANISWSGLSLAALVTTSVLMRRRRN